MSKNIYIYIYITIIILLLINIGIEIYKISNTSTSSKKEQCLGNTKYENCMNRCGTNPCVSGNPQAPDCVAYQSCLGNCSPLYCTG